MPRFLRIGDSVVHVPSISNVSMAANCFGRPYLEICYHTSSKSSVHYFVNWSDCEAMFNYVKKAMKEIDTLLADVPLTDPLTDIEKVVENGKRIEKEIKEEMIKVEELGKEIKKEVSSLTKGQDKGAN